MVYIGMVVGLSDAQPGSDAFSVVLQAIDVSLLLAFAIRYGIRIRNFEIDQDWQENGRAGLLEEGWEGGMHIKGSMLSEEGVLREQSLVEPEEIEERRQ